MNDCANLLPFFIQYCVCKRIRRRSKIAAYKYPRQVEIVDEIPKTVTGKFLRRALRDPDAARNA